MPIPEPPPRQYDDTEIAALRHISRKVWNQSFVPGRGPAWFAGGNWWPEELRRRAEQARSDADAFEIAANAMEREIGRAAIQVMELVLDGAEVVHDADWNEQDVRPRCVVGEYAGHDGPCRVEV